MKFQVHIFIPSQKPIKNVRNPLQCKRKFSSPPPPLFSHKFCFLSLSYLYFLSLVSQLLFLVVVNGKHILNISFSLKFVTSLFCFHGPWNSWGNEKKTRKRAFFDWVCAFIVLSSVRLKLNNVSILHNCI